MTNKERQLASINLTNWLMNTIMAAQVTEIEKKENHEMMMKMMKEATVCMDKALASIFGEQKIKVVSEKPDLYS